jgi:hypothetical protein
MPAVGWQRRIENGGVWRNLDVALRNAVSCRVDKMIRMFGALTAIIRDRAELDNQICRATKSSPVDIIIELESAGFTLSLRCISG